MDMKITAEMTGAEAFEASMKMLMSLGNVVNTAELWSKPRLDNSPDTNADIVAKLSLEGRDFFSGGSDTKEIAQVLADELIKRIDIEMKRQGVLQVGVEEQKANAIAAGSLTRGMQHYKRIVAKRIKDQITAQGGDPKAVSKGYAAERARLHNIPENIVGIASGDLLDNITDQAELKVTRR